MGRNNKALRNTYDRVENYLYPKTSPRLVDASGKDFTMGRWPMDAPPSLKMRARLAEAHNQVAYQKMSQGGTDVSGNVWLNDGSDCGRLPTLWNGSGTILQEAPGISWVV